MPQYVYTAIGKGGRDGEVRSGSGSYDLRTKLAGASKDGVTPEELIAGAWASCFGTTLLFAGREYDLDLSDAVIEATVTYNVDHDAGEYVVARADLKAIVPGEQTGALDEALRVAHGRCPISRLLENGVAEVAIGIAPVSPAPAGE